MSHLVCGGREDPNIDLQVDMYSKVMLIIKTTEIYRQTGRCKNTRQKVNRADKSQKQAIIIHFKKTAIKSVERGFEVRSVV